MSKKLELIDSIRIVTFKHNSMIQVELLGEGKVLKTLEKNQFNPGDDLVINFHGGKHGRPEDTEPEKD